MSAAHIGIDVGGTKALAVARIGEHTVWSHTRPTGRALGPSECVDLVSEFIEEFRAQAAQPSVSGNDIQGVGIGIPGLVDGTGESVRSSVILDGWEDVPLASMVTDRTGYACCVDNDVNNAARAELAARQHAEPALRDFLFIAVGTGIGGALILGGRVWAGVAGVAGEVGHMTATGIDGTCDCGRTGCVAVAAGGRSIEHRLGLPAGTLGDSHRPASADAALIEGARKLGEVVANAMNLLNLPLVVLGGGVGTQPGFAEQVEAAFRPAAMPEIAAACRVEVAHAGYDAGALGAALLAAGE